MFIDENRDSGLEQGVVRDGLFLLVVVVLDESVVTQQNRCESMQIFRYPVRADVQHAGPRLCLLVIPGIGEKSLEFGDVADGGLLAAAVQTGRVPLLETSLDGLRPHGGGVPAQAAVLLEERGERGHADGDRLDHRQWISLLTTAQQQ
ncbi:hypothetical protein AQI96_27800 [Streptomyces canus]|nr:hypothetical protein AQI96_27800 [Streptomyces canus]